MTVKLLTAHYLEFQNLKAGCTGSSESTLVKMPHFWKSHAAAHYNIHVLIIYSLQISSNLLAALPTGAHTNFIRNSYYLS